MALHAVFAVVLAIVISAVAQKDVGYPPDPYDPYNQEDVYQPDSYSPDYKPDTYEPDYQPDTYEPDYKPDTYEPDYKPDSYAPDYKPGVYAPEPYAPDKYVPEAPEGAVDPYQPDGYGAVGYGYGNDLLEQLKQKVLLRIADQKAKIDSIFEWRSLTLVKIEKISTLVTAWCRSKLFLFGQALDLKTR